MKKILVKMGIGFSLILLSGEFAHARETITFTIEKEAIRKAKGYGPAWNDEKAPLVVHVGDILIVKNDDTTDHIIHTYGGPFPHGDRRNPIKPGQSVQIEIKSIYDSNRDGPLYDHLAGKESRQFFWVKAE